MDGKRISLTINEVCHSLGIEYKNNSNIIDDVKRLSEIYRELKIIAGDLEAISERQDIKKLKNLIHKDAIEIDKLDHSIIQIAQKLKLEDD